MIRKFVKTSKLCIAFCVASISQSLSADTPITWPNLLSEPTSARHCEELDASFTAFRDTLERQHDQCLRKGGPTQQETGGTCSRAECQGLHNLLYVEWEKRRSSAVNSCRAQVRASQQACHGRIAVLQNEVIRQNGALKQSYDAHCFIPNAQPDMVRSCAKMKAEIEANDRSSSALIDRQHSECE